MPLPCGSPVVITLGFGSADDQLLTAIATAPALYHRLLDAHALISCLPDIGTPTVAEGDEGTVGAFVDRIMTGPAGSIRDR